LNLKIIKIFIFSYFKNFKIKIIFLKKFFSLINFSTKRKILFISTLDTEKTLLIQTSKGICVDPKEFVNKIDVEFIPFKMSVRNRKIKMYQQQVETSQLTDSLKIK
jgi:hypothetical protein